VRPAFQCLIAARPGIYREQRGGRINEGTATKEAFMAITGDRYVGSYEGHTIELIRNNWNKTLNLLIDGTKVASESRLWPHSITLTASLDHSGVQHTVVANSVVRFLTADDSVEVDGKPLPLTKTK
jgi:hypothetical protein